MSQYGWKRGGLGCAPVPAAAGGPGSPDPPDDDDDGGEDEEPSDDDDDDDDDRRRNRQSSRMRRSRDCIDHDQGCHEGSRESQRTSMAEDHEAGQLEDGTHQRLSRP